MNKYNDWENLLRIFNEDLEETGYSIDIVQPEDGFYNCEIWKDGKCVEVYAENYYEDELSDLVNEVWHYVATKKVDKGYSDKAKYMVAEQIVGMLENNVLNDCGMESFIGWLEDGDAFFNADCYTDEEIDEAMKLAREIATTVDELSWKLNIKPGE